MDFFEKISLVRPVGFEPTTLCLKGRCSTRLSYRRIIIVLFVFINSRWVYQSACPLQRRAGAFGGSYRRIIIIQFSTTLPL